MTIHSINFRIYYEDTDALGIVYHANYLKFAERARTEWLRTLGFEQSKMISTQGVGFVVTHLEIDFLASAQLDTLITIETETLKAGKVRFSMKQLIRCNELKLSTLIIDLACVNREGKPERIPENLYKRLNL
jgi:acyl-CoA thioester hydrolase